MKEAFANSLATMVGIPLVSNLGKYLEVPSIHGRVKGDLFQNILDGLSARREGWKMKFLSLAGRQILVQSVLNAIPMYSMLTMMISIGGVE